MNRTELYPDYMNNPAELRKIIATIDSVRNDKDLTVDSIFIKGFASPEGSYANNVRLAKGRTATLKEYVENMYSFPHGLIHTSYEAEDWEGLREWVEASNLPHRSEILAIIDSDLAPDPKNTAIQRRFPGEYAMLLATVYPTLRHSDYSIYYTIRAFTDPEEIIGLMHTAPGKLNEKEVTFALSTLIPGTPRYYDLYETAARLYPKNQDFCLGAANAAIARGDYRGAEAYLDRAGHTERTVYTRAVIAALQQDYTTARSLYEQAERMGAPYAAEALRNLNEAGDGRLKLVPAE
ncbi:MAG: tetratricopeptide repeat protein [Muribaculaceae bacterium]|nr:tetratricopeptide repeat protein [Muribaculaceae bacterium]